MRVNSETMPTETARWPTKKFGDIALFRNGLNFLKSDNGDKVKVVGVANFQNNFRVSYDQLDTVRIAGALSSDDLLKDGDLLFVRSNGNKALIGRCILIDELNEPVSFSGFTIRARITDPSVLPEFIGVYFRSEKAREQLHEAGAGSQISNLSQGLLASLEVSLPSLPEQETLTKALRDADALVESLGQLLVKKREVKQGAMQELLTGKKRLPGFNDKWNVKLLGELGTTYGGLTGKTKADFGEGSGQYVTFMNVMSNVVIDCGIFERVRISPTESQNCVLKGDLLFNGSSETPEEVAMCAVLKADIPNLFLNSFCFGFRLRDGADVDGLFFAYLLRGTTGREMMKSLAQGSTRYNLSKAALLRSSIRVPSLPEQNAIADLLSDMDAEIAAIETKLSKARQIKQGMMQELLTGRIRLV